jgi:hypothetical protein
MLQASATPLSAMDPATMRAVFNLLASERGAPKAPRGADRFTLGKGIALLRATPIPKKATAAPVKRTRKENGAAPARIRPFALAELARVVAYEHKETGETIAANIFEGGAYDDSQWLSVGASYAEVVKTVRKKFPESRISSNVLRRFAHHVRAAAKIEAAGGVMPPAFDGYCNILLPETRPQARRGVPSAKRIGRPNNAKRTAKRNRDARASARLSNRRAKRRAK